MKNKIFLGVSGVKGVKTIVFLFLCLLMILPLSSCYNKENREEILKVYNWADYIDEDVLANLRTRSYICFFTNHNFEF